MANDKLGSPPEGVPPENPGTDEAAAIAVIPDKDIEALTRKMGTAMDAAYVAASRDALPIILPKTTGKTKLGTVYGPPHSQN